MKDGVIYKTRNIYERDRYYYNKILSFIIILLFIIKTFVTLKLLLQFD